MAQTGVWGESRGESVTLVVVVAVVPNMYERALAHGVCVCVRVRYTHTYVSYIQSYRTCGAFNAQHLRPVRQEVILIITGRVLSNNQ